MVRRGQSARESQEEISRALEAHRRRRSPGRSRVRSLVSILLGIVGLLTAAVVLSGLGVTAYHVSRGATLNTAIEMSVEDVRVAVVCPGSPGLIVDFVGRTPPESGSPSLAQTHGPDWVGRVCDG